MTVEYENTLRRIVILILGGGDNADYKVTPERLEKWKEKREIENKKYKGGNPEQRIIYYSDFFDLKPIIINNWQKFTVILGKQRQFESNFDQIETLRNTISHGRSIFPFQEALIKGITGALKSMLVKYHNQNMKVEDHFIRILKMSDNLGNQWEIGNLNISGMITKSTLRVDDTINIVVEAYDPKDRDIYYEFSSSEFHEINQTGNLELTITKEMIKPRYQFHVKAFTENEEYKNEDYKVFHYGVIP